MWLVIRTSDGKVRHQSQCHVDHHPEEEFRRAIAQHRAQGCALRPKTEHIWTCRSREGVETTIALEPDAPPF